MLYSHDIENLALIPIIGKTSFAKKKLKKKKSGSNKCNPLNSSIEERGKNFFFFFFFFVFGGKEYKRCKICNYPGPKGVFV